MSSPPGEGEDGGPGKGDEGEAGDAGAHVGHQVHAHGELGAGLVVQM